MLVHLASLRSGLRTVQLYGLERRILNWQTAASEFRMRDAFRMGLAFMYVFMYSVIAVDLPSNATIRWTGTRFEPNVVRIKEGG